MSKLQNEKELSESTGIKLDFLRKDRLTRRLIPFIKLGGSVRYDPDDVQAALRSLRVPKNGGAE